MGMFDEVRVMQELAAPVGLPALRLEQFRVESAALGFQTKDFDCVLDRYVVTAYGGLLRQECSWDTKEVLGEERLEFHGRFEIHTVFFADDAGMVEHNGLKVRVLGPTFSGEAYVISYVLKFTDGQLVAVEQPCATRL
jgi:hypothetical protein